MSIRHHTSSHVVLGSCCFVSLRVASVTLASPPSFSFSLSLSLSLRVFVSFFEEMTSSVSSKIRLVTFDFLGTLAGLRSKVTVGHFYASEAKKVGFDAGLRHVGGLNSAFLSAFREISLKHPNFGAQEGLDSYQWWRQVVVNTVINSELVLPSPELEQQQAEKKEYQVQRLDMLAKNLYQLFSGRACYQCFPETKMVLQNLQSRHVKLGVISNSDERLHNVLKELGLGDYFSFTVTSKEVKAEKPMKEIFCKALEFAGVHRE